MKFLVFVLLVACGSEQPKPDAFCRCLITDAGVGSDQTTCIDPVTGREGICETLPPVDAQ